MTVVYILLGIVLVALVAVAIILSIVLKRTKQEKKEDSLKKEDLLSLEQKLSQQEVVSNYVANQLTPMVGQLQKLSNDFTQTQPVLVQKIYDLRLELEKSLRVLQENNTKELEKIRESVDEKLSSTVKKRFDESFQAINVQLEQLVKTFAELKSLQSGVNDLNNIFKNIKTRGVWGEVSLDSLLSQILTSSQYKSQFKLSKGNVVDFAIVLPGKKENGEVYLPIDSKFPVEDFLRLVDASTTSSMEEIERAKKALVDRVKGEAKSIQDKYVDPPKTTDFAIMYLPTESLYCEVVKIDGLMEELQNKFRIVVCGPSTITALLNSLQMGFKSIAIEKRSIEVANLLSKFGKEFNTFTDMLDKSLKQIGTAQSTMDGVRKKTERIKKSLSKVYEIEGMSESTLEETQEDLLSLIESQEE